MVNVRRRIIWLAALSLALVALTPPSEASRHAPPLKRLLDRPKCLYLLEPPPWIPPDIFPRPRQRSLLGGGQFDPRQFSLPDPRWMGNVYPKTPPPPPKPPVPIKPPNDGDLYFMYEDYLWIEGVEDLIWWIFDHLFLDWFAYDELEDVMMILLPADDGDYILDYGD